MPVLCDAHVEQQTNIVWTIAGSDSGGGAGIQADLATIQDLGCHGCSVITTLTAQNTAQVDLVEPVSNQMLLAQLNTLANDLFPAAIKIGLIANQQQVETIAAWLTSFKAEHEQRLKQRNCLVVLDPVMVASSGDKLNQQPLNFAPLLPLVDLVTPNQHELYPLAKSALNCALTSSQSYASLPAIDKPNSLSDMVQLARFIAKQFNCNVLAKGGDANWQGNDAIDMYITQHVAGGSAEHNDGVFILKSERVATQNHHGSGCTLSSAIASFVANEFVLHDAVVLAKAYVSRGLNHSINIGAGSGCLGRTGWPNTLVSMPYIINATGLATEDIDKLATQIERDLSLLHFRPLHAPITVYPVVASIEILRELLEAGCKTAQLRLKPDAELSPKSQQGVSVQSWLSEKIQQAVALGNQYNAQVFINDHWELAIEHKAFGVHLGQEDALTADLAALSSHNLALGLSSHSYFEILLAAQLKPSYIALGHIFPTTTKQMPSAPQGIYKLRCYATLLKGHFTTVAIGGIDEQRLATIASTQCDSVAVVRAVTESTDPSQAYQRLETKWQQVCDHFTKQESV
ncbi:bifunctional hydroxymethylpyrimidine kinase/phosphomethylpyrimidine kinase [Shewanella gaetbuli]|uniref:hydroxymethylpyrimidine kinase n=1 Tax=Shewanella gaetbuli TaxID=220752 RepID=A0A9X1ZS90_9GAMM|nr:bifunctional hydroxymethylpyrimidine kinase/phosphomethylpyrimidine kinase [Shewanella gaetbuli]MCL1143158.1 bifunctional hydroxymethylpyrimidine kinase/phosphomethylpyrimidine kinase [Shewanella gaetbuli]